MFCACQFGLSLPPLEAPTSEFGLLQHVTQQSDKRPGMATLDPCLVLEGEMVNFPTTTNAVEVHSDRPRTESKGQEPTPSPSRCASARDQT